jgi:hypothetical protein
MTCSERVSQWRQTVSSHLPHLSGPQAAVLALWSLGIVRSGSCGLSQVSALLAMVLGQSEETVRQRLREMGIANTPGGANPLQGRPQG